MKLLILRCQERFCPVGEQNSIGSIYNNSFPVRHFHNKRSKWELSFQGTQPTFQLFGTHSVILSPGEEACRVVSVASLGSPPTTFC